MNTSQRVPAATGGATGGPDGRGPFGEGPGGRTRGDRTRGGWWEPATYTDAET
jgi:hypothetical protein